MDDVVAHIAKFVSGIWQIHPFGEGNTRTTAVFTIKYLRSIGFDVNNDLFADKSWFFRNALVRANYRNVRKGVEPDMSFLILFFRNLMMEENHELKNRYMIINAPQQSTEQADRTSTEQANRTTHRPTFINRKSYWDRTMFIENNNGENRVKASPHFYCQLFDTSYSKWLCCSSLP